MSFHHLTTSTPLPELVDVFGVIYKRQGLNGAFKLTGIALDSIISILFVVAIYVNASALL